MDANFGIRLREFILPIFKDPADCYMALMLWHVVGDTIPLESEISARFRDELNDPDFIYDLYGDESSSYIPCCFDTRAEYIQPGRGACVYLDKLHLCLLKYAQATGTHSGKYVFDDSYTNHTSFMGLFYWLNKCRPDHFESDLLDMAIIRRLREDLLAGICASTG